MPTKPGLLIDYITVKTLAGACPAQLSTFRREWPDGAPLTAATLARARELKLDVEWALSRILSAPLLAEYKRQHAPLLAEYERQHDALLAEYERQLAPLLAEYERQLAPLLAEYERQRAPLLAEYERQLAPLLAEYERQHDALLVKLIEEAFA